MKTERMIVMALDALNRAVAEKNYSRIADLLGYIAMLRRDRIRELERVNATLRLTGRYRKVS